MNQLTTIAALPSGAGCAAALPPEVSIIGVDVSTGNDVCVVQRFEAVRITRAEWLRPAPENEGERILWSDGTTHGVPEDEGDHVTVLRRVGPPEVLPTVNIVQNFTVGGVAEPRQISKAVAVAARRHFWGMA